MRVQTLEADITSANLIANNHLRKLGKAIDLCA